MEGRKYDWEREARFKRTYHSYAGLSLRERLELRDMVDRGILRLTDEIDNISLDDILPKISAFRELNHKSLTLEITSPGGGAYQALAVYDELRRLAEEKNIKIVILVRGFAASAASMILLQAGDLRCATKHARFHLHEVKRWALFEERKTSELEDEVAEMKSITNTIIDIIMNKTGHTREEVEKMIARKEVWMTAEEALDWKFIDKII